jgi:hypothetical protein
MRLAPEKELKHANDRYTYMADMEKCMHKLEEKGFSDQYKVKDGRLCCIDSGKEFLPEDVKAVNFYRFEGISNPDDMAILYAIETIDGRKGTLVNAYGLYADDEIEHFMMNVETHKSVKGVDVY